MDVEVGIKVVAAIVAIFGVFRYAHEMKVWKSSHYRAQYEFSKQFFADIQSGNLHPFTIEKGYHAIAGNEVVEPEDIKYILSLENPAKCLKDYLRSRQLLESLDTKGDLKIEFRSKYKRRWFRSWLKYFYITLYFVFAFFTLSPFPAQSYFDMSYKDMFSWFAITLPVGGYFAVVAMSNYTKLLRGEELVANQSSYTKQVITGP